MRRKARDASNKTLVSDAGEDPRSQARFEQSREVKNQCEAMDKAIDASRKVLCAMLENKREEPYEACAGISSKAAGSLADYSIQEKAQCISWYASGGEA